MTDFMTQLNTKILNFIKRAGIPLLVSTGTGPTPDTINFWRIPFKKKKSLFSRPHKTGVDEEAYYAVQALQTLQQCIQG